MPPCLGSELFSVTARSEGNSELALSDPGPEDYGNVISSASSSTSSKLCSVACILECNVMIVLGVQGDP